MPDAEEIYYRLRAAAEQEGFVDDSADELLGQTAEIIAADPRNEEESESDPSAPTRTDKSFGVRYRNGQPYYDMYTLAGNLVVHHLTDQLRADMTAGNVTRNDLPRKAAELLAEVDRTGHHEIHDTEPPWAVVDALNDTCQRLGWQPITKEDFA